MHEENVYGYVRVSTYNQVREGYSLEEQKDQIQAFCRENKYNLIDILHDDGKSGAAADEEELSIEPGRPSNNAGRHKGKQHKIHRCTQYIKIMALRYGKSVDTQGAKEK